MEVAQRTLVPPDFRLGIYPGEPDATYFRRQLGVATNSTLKILDTQTPGHYLHYIRTGEDDDASPIKETDAQIIGKAFHCLVLEPDQLRDRYREIPDFGDMRSPKNRARVDQWKGHYPGFTFLKPGWMKLIEDMRASVMRHRTARMLVEQGRREVVFRWIDADTGLACKSKVDLWDEELGFYLDLKSCLSAHPDVFGRVVANYRYHVQHCMYATGAAACSVPIKHFFLVPVEKIPPYFSAVYNIDAAAEEKGFEILRRSLAKLRSCMDRYLKGEDVEEAFPAYGHDIRSLSIPGWAFAN